MCGGECDGEVFHYRDNTGLEIDAVVETAGGNWLAAEVKLGGERAIEAAARSRSAQLGTLPIRRDFHGYGPRHSAGWV